MTFNTAVELVLKHEGGYIDHPSDPGGETKYGISKRSYPSIDIKNLTKTQAIGIYKIDYWDKIKGDHLENTLSTILFDMAVNMGISQAVKLLQKACDVVQDGIISPNTIAASKRLNGRIMAEKLTQERIMFYASLKTFGTFGRGWVARSINTLTEAL